jgi:hypothetical protein
MGGKVKGEGRISEHVAILSYDKSYISYTFAHTLEFASVKGIEMECIT